jgi:UDP-N-acetylglucosamine 2-epimerase (non-hydrolysing)
MGPLVIVAGARPNLMKVAPILRALDARGAAAVLVHTGQHYDDAMSGVFFRQLGLRAPDVDLRIGSAGHGAQTGRIMVAFDEALDRMAIAPRGVVVVGDVNSTMAAALVAVKRGLPAAHVEAGLRSGDRTMPEEINRLVTDAVADLLLVSEPSGAANLAAEGVRPDRVRYVGNVMIDSLVHQLPAARALDLPGQLGLAAGAYAVATLHRPSNVDDPARLRALVGFLGRLAGAMPTVFPVHPRTDERLIALGLRDRLAADPAIRLLPALGYREFVGLIAGARVVVSDSGGVQEETTYLGVPCVTLRTTTERPVTISHGTNTLVGDDLEAAWGAVETARAGRPTPAGPIDGWDGRAAERIVDAIEAAWRPP